ncbi:histidinol dehydrogenase, partial [Candidatus Hodgkinia cicadicola]|uniref:histidinol dehydrogenase n=1 Tax=Candidatus Hodgkinia cicadicola TaxID=573658 RepID=UPI0011BAC1C7
ATPYRKIKDKRLFMACASICGVECIYTFGGPQAIIAMAIGTEVLFGGLQWIHSRKFKHVKSLKCF